jgi:GntR family transcriptional regulator
MTRGQLATIQPSEGAISHISRKIAPPTAKSVDNFRSLLYYPPSTADTAMFFQIDFADNVPIYDQVVRQIKFAVAGGVLKEGELVTSVRELARELTINPNTVARAFHRLQDDGILTSVRGTGLAVAAGAAERCRAERIELIRSRLAQVFAEAKQSRIDPRKLRELVEQQLTELESAPSKERK